MLCRIMPCRGKPFHLACTVAEQTTACVGLGNAPPRRRQPGSRPASRRRGPSRRRPPQDLVASAPGGRRSGGKGGHPKGGAGVEGRSAPAAEAPGAAFKREAGELRLHTRMERAGQRERPEPHLRRSRRRGTRAGQRRAPSYTQLLDLKYRTIYDGYGRRRIHGCHGHMKTHALA